ncbi:MAG: DUF4178 domain-containing protein [Eubacterium sp.]|nr:DUF4178 domain-containing protein [Eubacterium sp.]
MAHKEYFINERIKADGDYYLVIGRITFLNLADGKSWDEYRLRAENFNNAERWLSVDNAYNEYSLSKINPTASTLGYHIVDQGRARVTSVMGDVGDVVVGDEVTFEEYEDREEEKIVSIEHWEDETEYSSGYYLDPWEFGKDGEVTQRISSGGGGMFAKVMMVILIMAGLGSGYLGDLFDTISVGSKKISTYVKKSTLYEYTTSITGEEKQSADVYEYLSGSSLLQNYSEEEALMMVAHDIIDGINGNSESIQQNDEKDDKTVAILTKKEYCIIYRSEDDKILVQVSSRKYAYTTDKEPYRSRNRTRRYYRRFYRSRGYYNDESSFSRSRSAYTDYSDDPLDYNSSNELNTYSDSVRQSSIGSRSSDGGGLSSGK